MRELLSPILAGLIALPAVFIGNVCPAAETTAAEPGADGAMVDAVWVEQEAEFAYIGVTTFYSCNGIRDKVRQILRNVGAGRDSTVIVRGCIKQNGPEVQPYVEIRVALPQPATPELLAKLETGRTERQKVARVQGAGSEVDEASATFPARWSRVIFRETHNSVVKNGDCELMEHLVKHVFVPMGLRVAEDSTLDCGLREVSVFSVDLKLDVLKAVPQAAMAPERL